MLYVRGGFIDDSLTDEISDINKHKKAKKKKITGAMRTKNKNYRKPALITLTSLNKNDSDDVNDNAYAYITTEIIPEYIKKTMKYDNIDVLQINIKYPQVKLKSDIKHSHEKAEKRINKFYDDTAQYFIRFAEKVLYKNAVSEYLNIARTQDKEVINYQHFKPFGAVLNFEVTYNKNNFLCIYFDANIYSGKGRGNISRKAHIWDLSAGVIVPSFRFVDFSGDNKKKICLHICDIITGQRERGEEYYINTDFKTVYKYFNQKNMFITERGHNFFFPQNSLSPSEWGIVSFIYTP